MTQPFCPPFQSKPTVDHSIRCAGKCFQAQAASYIFRGGNACSKIMESLKSECAPEIKSETSAYSNVLFNDVLTPENARSISEQFIQTIPSYPGGHVGRGIVIPAGGLRYFANAWVCIKMLRHLGCRLPVQIWYLGGNELDEQLKTLILPLGVECVDAFEIRKKHPARTLHGWPLKAYSLLYSSFKEVLFLDADNVPTMNPEFLFEGVQFRETGAIFWPDFESFGPEHPIWDICGVPYRDEPQVESGQIMVDKERCWKALCLSVWYNDHADFYYNHIYGDKDTFHMAFRKLHQPYSMPQTPLLPLSSTMCQHDFDGNRLFQHRNFDKWNLFSDNKRVEGFLYEDECRFYLDELRKHLAGRWGKWCFDQASKSAKLREATKQLVDRLFDYQRIGYDRRPMTFLENGVIGLGQGGCELFWDLKEKNGKVVLEICSDRELTCDLEQNANGIWRGRWVRHEKMPIELGPMTVRFEPGSKSPRLYEAAKCIVNGLFDYRRVGYDRRPMTFFKNGVIGKGAAGCEVFWDLVEINGQIVMKIYSEKEITCELTEGEDRVWRGRWMHYEQMPIELSPKVKSRSAAFC